MLFRSGLMKLTARDLKNLGIVEQVIHEEKPLSEERLKDMVPVLEKGIGAFLKKYENLSKEELLEHRYERFRRI